MASPHREQIGTPSSWAVLVGRRSMRVGWRPWVYFFHFFTACDRPPVTPPPPLPPGPWIFFAIFFAYTGGLFHRPKRGEVTLQSARLCSSSRLTPQAAWGASATEHPRYRMSVTSLCWNFVTGRRLILVEGQKRTKMRLKPRGLAFLAVAVPAQHAVPPTAAPPTHLQFHPAGGCRWEFTSQIVHDGPPRHRARKRSRPRW